MSHSASFDKTSRDPVDRKAAAMFLKGVQCKAPKIACDHWETCPPIRHPRWVKDAVTGEDLTGRRVGRFQVIGMYRLRAGRWVVRCDCGDFEIRTAKAIKNPANSGDKCVVCRKIDLSLRHDKYWKESKRNERTCKDQG